MTHNVTLHGIETGTHEMYAELSSFVDSHAIVPVIDSVWPLDDVAGALRHLAAGHHLGKVVVVPELPPGSTRPGRPA